MSKIKLTLLALCLNSLTSCVAPPDVVTCVSLSTEKYWCTYTISEIEFTVDKSETEKWKTFIEPGLVSIPAKSWGELKKYIINNCKKHSECSKDIVSWEKKVKKIDSNLK